jgi:hypothetical protein
MDCAVMGAAQRDREFIAGVAAKCTRLRVPKMMCVQCLAAADQACLLDT